jgi:hypothetical protein
LIQINKLTRFDRTCRQGNSQRNSRGIRQHRLFHKSSLSTVVRACAVARHVN